MLYLRQSTASQSVLIGPFVDDGDGNTPATGLTIDAADIRLSKNGANIAAKNSGGGTHDELGYYTITLDATDTNTVGRLQLMVHESGALPVYHEFWVLEEAVFDDLFAASAPGIPTAAEVVNEWESQSQADPTGFHVNVLEWTGNAVTASSGNPDVNVESMDTGVVTAGVIAADAIGASELAADAVAEIQSGLATAAELAKVPKSDGTATWNATALASIQSEANDALVAYDPPTKAELDSGLAGLNDLSAAEVNAEVDAAIETYHLDHLLAATYDPASKPGAADALLNELVENDGGVARFTANALEQAPSGTGGDATEAKQDAILAILGTPSDLDGGGATLAAMVGDTFGALLSVNGSVDAVEALLEALFMETTGTNVGATGNDTTHVHLAGLNFENGQLNNHLLILLDDSTGRFYSRWITDWVLATELATLHEALPASPTSSDRFWVLAIRRDVSSSGGLDAAGVRAAIGMAGADLDTQLAAIPTLTELESEIDVIEAAVAAIPTADDNADALLGRNIAGGSSTGRLVKDALRFLRNRWVIAGGTLTVYQEDDTTEAWSAAATQTAGDPVSEVDPS